MVGLGNIFRYVFWTCQIELLQVSMTSCQNYIW